MSSDAVVRIGFDNSQLQAGAAKAQATVQKLEKTVGSTFKGIAGAAATAFAGIGLVNLGKDAVVAAAQLEGMKGSMAALMGSSELAAAEIDRLRETAKLPGLDFQNAVKGSARLQAVGLSADAARETLKELGNVAALSGLSASDFQEIVDAISDIGSSGDITDEKIDRLTERSGLLSRVLKDTFGASNAAGIRAMGVSAEQFLAGLTQGLSELERADFDSINNKLKNTNDQIQAISASIGTNLLPAVALSLEGFNKMGEAASPVWNSIISMSETAAAMMNGVPYEEAVSILGDMEKQAKKTADELSQLKVPAAKAASTVATPSKKDSKSGNEDANRYRDLSEARNKADEARADALEELLTPLEKLSIAEQNLNNIRVSLASLGNAGPVQDQAMEALRLTTAQFEELKKVNALKQDVDGTNADAEKAAQSAQMDAAAKKAAAEYTEFTYNLETQILAARGLATEKATKLANEADRELRILQAKKTLMDSTNVSAQTALNMATARVNAEDKAAAPPQDGPRRKEPKPRKNWTQGYTNAQREASGYTNSFRGLDAMKTQGPSAHQQLQAQGRIQAATPALDAMRTQAGQPLLGKAIQNGKEQPAQEKGGSVLEQLLGEIQTLNKTMSAAVGG